ncbi:MAG: S-layer homology domain-containing protein, partial [Peptoniphilus harei]|nr:S-layer homology domain-containing protein [Peptoniphilus harei]
KGSKYTLLDNAFKAPNENQEFKAWEVNGKEVAAGTEITADKDTVIKAIWKEKTTTDPSQPGGGTTPGENPEKPNPSQPANPTDTPPTVNENPDGSTNVTPGPGTGKVVIPTTGKNGENPIDVVVEQDDKGKWENKNNVPGVTVDPDTGKTTIPADRKVDKDHIISESKPKVKSEEPSYEENEIPGIKIRDHYTPTFPVYVTVPKTEKVEKAEEVPVSLETHKAYIAGYEDNTLRAEGNLTRAEAAAMVTRLAGLDLSDTSMPAFKDMQKNAWYFRYINAAVKAKMLDADNGMMRPNDKITRAEFAKMLAAIDKENSSVSKFDDIKGHRYEKEINKIYGNNRIEGYEDGSFRPDAYLTRAESAAFLNRMFNRIADKEAYAGLEDKLAKFKDFDASKWYYDEMVEATNSHELSRRGKASDKFGRVYEKWTRILPSDVK